MEGSLGYWNPEQDDRQFIVREQPAEYLLRLEEATERYLERLRQLDLRCTGAKRNDETIYAEVVMLTDAMLEACARFEREAQDRELIRAARFDFYRKTNPLLTKSYCIERIRTWPQGGQGDFMTLELCYRNTPLSQGIGWYLDRYILDASLGIGARQRIEMLSDILREELATREEPRVLDIACGSARELTQLVPEMRQSRARFTCIDLDGAALDYALDRMATLGVADQITFLRYNALRLFDYDIAMMEFGPQDIIYSVGYFDYLPDDFLAKMLRTLYAMLAPGGTLITAFKDAAQYNPQVYHWLANWDGFFQRHMSDFERLLREAGIPDSALSLRRTEAGAIVFYTIRKGLA